MPNYQVALFAYHVDVLGFVLVSGKHQSRSVSFEKTFHVSTCGSSREGFCLDALQILYISCAKQTEHLLHEVVSNHTSKKAKKTLQVVSRTGSRMFRWYSQVRISSSNPLSTLIGGSQCQESLPCQTKYLHRDSVYMKKFYTQS